MSVIPLIDGGAAVAVCALLRSSWQCQRERLLVSKNSEDFYHLTRAMDTYAFFALMVALVGVQLCYYLYFGVSS